MTEPTTESLGAAQEFAAAYAATGRGTLSDDAIRGVALALDEMKGRVAVDPLVEVFRTLPLNGDAGCDKLTDAEWLTVANAARAELTTPVLTEEMVRRATGQRDAFPVLTWRTGHMQGAISCQTFADNLNAALCAALEAKS